MLMFVTYLILTSFQIGMTENENINLTRGPVKGRVQDDRMLVRLASIASHTSSSEKGAHSPAGDIKFQIKTGKTSSQRRFSMFSNDIGKSNRSRARASRVLDCNSVSMNNHASISAHSRSAAVRRFSIVGRFSCVARNTLAIIVLVGYLKRGLMKPICEVWSESS
jgi:hypothetical protein